MPPAPDAKAAILASATRLFAEHGFDGVSLRRLTQDAGVNLAAVNYHFRSKEALADAVVESFVNPVNEERLARLAQLSTAAKGRPIRLESLLDAFLRPAVETIRESAHSEKLFFQLMGRCLSDRSLPIPASSRDLLSEVISRFTNALQQTLPGIPMPELIWRLHFTVGMLIHALAHSDGFNELAPCLEVPPNSEHILAMVQTYALAALQAPPTNF